VGDRGRIDYEPGITTPQLGDPAIDREGRSFTESLETANWMPELAIDMIGIGERSGSLREMLDEVATFYDAESEVRLEQLTTTLEPAILVVMGGVVVVILLAIYLPIIQSISHGPMMNTSQEEVARASRP